MSRPQEEIPLTPNEVVIQLSKLARELDETVRLLGKEDREATEKRAAYDLAFSRAFMAASGSIDARKHQAVIDTHEQRLAADVAEEIVRHLRRRIDSIKIRIDVGRSYGAAVRAELSLTSSGVDT